MTVLPDLNSVRRREIQWQIEKGTVVSAVVSLSLSPDTPVPDSVELSEDEKQRFHTFQSVKQAKLFLAGRLLLREILGAALPGEDCRIEIGPQGKPFVSHPESPEFNLSHCDVGILASFCKEVPLGVDVEHLNRKVHTEAVSRRVFSEKERSWMSAQGPEGFFRVWTRKEARVKATGGGLSSGISSLCTCTEEGWNYEEIRLPDLIGTVAYRGPLRPHAVYPFSMKI